MSEPTADRPLTFPRGAPTALVSLAVHPSSSSATSSPTPPTVWILTLLANHTPDNRLTRAFLLAILDALRHVESWWDGAEADVQKRGAAIVTTGVPDEKSKFFSNGLDIASLDGDPDFFDETLFRVYESLLSFPIPAIAAVGGHCFAAGMGLAMAHDYRVMNENRGYMCMNEVDFGAQVPLALQAVLASKIVDPLVHRKMILEGHRFSAREAHRLGFVDVVSPQKGESGGARTTLEAAVELARRVGKKAAFDAWGCNKIVVNQPYISVLREKNEVAMAKL